MVQSYVLNPGEFTGQTWIHDGKKKSVTPPPFACPVIQQMCGPFGEYVTTHTPEYVQALTISSPPMVRRVFLHSLDVRDKYPLVDEALQLWVGSRIIERGWHIVGDESMGVKTMDDPSCPYYGTKPITMALDYQIDYTFMQDLRRRRDAVLRNLKARIMKRKREDWLEVFLTVFLILNSIEQFTQHDQRYHRRNNPEVRWYIAHK